MNPKAAAKAMETYKRRVAVLESGISSEQYKTCARKKPYETEELAKKDLEILGMKNARDLRTLNVYTCKYCGKFHVGHKQY